MAPSSFRSVIVVSLLLGGFQSIRWLIGVPFEMRLEPSDHSMYLILSFLSPLAKFPNSQLAALLSAYKVYFNVWQSGWVICESAKILYIVSTLRYVLTDHTRVIGRVGLTAAFQDSLFVSTPLSFTTTMSPFIMAYTLVLHGGETSGFFSKETRYSVIVRRYRRTQRT